MKYYLIAGEASGDLHASNLMAEIRNEDPSADFRFMGGDLMQAAGGVLVKHYREMAFMGLIPVLLNLRSILRNMRVCCGDIRRYRPDVVVLIDYPGFNLRIAKYAKTKLGLPVCYYISPKIWAWKKYRIRDFRRYIDRMFCILPFEKDFYGGLNYEVDYVGNPSVDSVALYKQQAEGGETFLRDENLSPVLPVIAVLAGSRHQEIKDNLPAMLDAAASCEGYQVVVAGAPGIDARCYAKYAGGREVCVVSGKTYALLNHSCAALVTSGTATLETALFRVPQVVCYRTPLPKLSGFIFRRFFHTPYISLVNLIAGREIVRELYADRFSRRAIGDELRRILDDEAYRAGMLGGYGEVIRLLGEPGASRRAAHLLVAFVGNLRATGRVK
ncbi:MAG: lipid-A-disaccharide synthase [Tannerellaceae bacterium]|jgi:lipid-A-disaccharide synthase|nr:lipid-A-disaccharide synthase [Tannerellaceae bacterium]